MANLGASNHVARVLSAANRLADAGAASRIAVPGGAACLTISSILPGTDLHKRSRNQKFGVSQGRWKD
jgi:hypothetical protein